MPRGQLVIAAGNMGGRTTIRGGPSAGMDLAIEGSVSKYGPFTDSYGGGVVSVRPDPPGPDCEKIPQVVELTTCETSVVVGF